MTELFYTILNMSISASVLVLVVLLLRLLIRKAPKWVTVLLWGLVAVRLICPFALETPFSLMPKTEWIVQVGEEELFLNSVPPDSIPAMDISSLGKDITVHYYTTDPEIEIHKSLSVPFVLSCIWLGGIAVMLVYLAVSYIRIYRRISNAKKFQDNIYTSETISSPFVFGVIHPRICLPENMDAVSMSYVIAHEEAHIRRKDHWWKPLGFLLLTVHWFNPVMWLAYILLCRDIELACDERVAMEYDDSQRADYSEALLECSVKRSMISACPLAFGEVGVKQRIKSVLNYKKPAFWIVVVAVIACAAAAVCFLTNPMQKPTLSMDEHDWYFERAYITDLEKNIIEEEYQPGLQPKTENAEPVNTILVPDGEPMWYQFVTGDWDTDRIGLHFIPEETDSRTARYTVELYRDTGELYQGADAMMEPMTDGDGYVLTVYYTADGSEIQLIFTTEKMPGIVNGEKKLTLEDVLTLSEKQMALTWEDFAEYTYTDVGSGLFVCVYEIDETFYLQITGGSMLGTPMSIYLYAKNGESEEYVDIRRTYADEDIVKDFIRENQSEQSSTDKPGDFWNFSEKQTSYSFTTTASDEIVHYSPLNFAATRAESPIYLITLQNQSSALLNVQICRTSDDAFLESYRIDPYSTVSIEWNCDNYWYLSYSSRGNSDAASFTAEISLLDKTSDAEFFGKTRTWFLDSAWEKAQATAAKNGWELEYERNYISYSQTDDMIQVYFSDRTRVNFIVIAFLRDENGEYTREFLDQIIYGFPESSESSEKHLLGIPDPVIAYQSDIREQAAETIFGAVTVYASGIENIEQIPTATVGISEEILLYRLDYWITKGINGLAGTPSEDIYRETVYFAMFNNWTSDTWIRLGTITEDEINAKYGTSEMISKYGNKFTAAASHMKLKYYELVRTNPVEFTAVITKFDPAFYENGMMSLNIVEFITPDDTERIAELELSEQDMISGYYIHDEVESITTLTLPEDTEYIFFDWWDEYTDETDERYEILGERWISTRDAELFYEYWLPYKDAGAPGYPFVFTASEESVVIKEIPLM